jgi:hypothetical protein
MVTCIISTKTGQKTKTDLFSNITDLIYPWIKELGIISYKYYWSENVTRIQTKKLGEVEVIFNDLSKTDQFNTWLKCTILG